MESGRTYQTASTRKLSFRVQIGSADINSKMSDGLNDDELIGEHALNKQNKENTEEQIQDTAENEITNAQGKLNQFSPIRRIPHVNRVEEYNAIEDIRQQCIFYLWTIFFGKSRANEMADKMGISSYNGMNSNVSYQGRMQNNGWQTSGQLQQLQPMPVKMMSLTAESETLYMESETTSFSTVGTVKTADGREINFNLDVSMSRSFTKYTKETVETVGNFIDPLVINLNGNIAEVSDQKFYFDLNADGEEEAISRLCEDSGYLALDLNEDGKINDGSELFGTKSGDGFADLAVYDEDKNGWIDENDDIWNKLKIWVQDENGNSKLYSLAEQGVGAICLQNVSTEFGQRGTDGEINAAIRNTGIFLYENGAAGTIQHLDHVVNQEEKLAQYA